MASAYRAPPRTQAVFALIGACLLCEVHTIDFGLGGIFGSGPTSKQHATDELNADTFDDYMKANPVTAVLFYAPWCFYSQQVMPAWDLAGQKLKIHDRPV